MLMDWKCILNTSSLTCLCFLHHLISTFSASSHIFILWSKCPVCVSVLQVQGVLRRHWNQYRIQFGSTFANTEALRSTSYTTSSMTEVHRCYSIDSHMDTLNGKSFHNMETTILRSDNIYMWGSLSLHAQRQQTETTASLQPPSSVPIRDYQKVLWHWKRLSLRSQITSSVIS